MNKVDKKMTFCEKDESFVNKVDGKKKNIDYLHASKQDSWKWTDPLMPLVTTACFREMLGIITTYKK